jgi:hypothetical protein
MNPEPASDRVDNIPDFESLGVDLARRHKATASSGGTIDQAVVAADLATLERDGYVILENLIAAQDCDRVRAAVTPLLDRAGRNTFEGERTQRVYSMLEKTRACDALVDHPRVLALLDRLFLPNYLLSQLQVINIQPGERAQLLHFDDAFYPIPRPRPPVGAATVWAIDPFTDSNRQPPLGRPPQAHRLGCPAHRRNGPRILRVLPRHALARRRRQPLPKPPSGSDRTVLRTLAASPGGIHPVRQPRHRPHRVRGHPPHARL